MGLPRLQRLAPSFGVLLVSSLAFSSQWLFRAIEPGHLTPRESIVFNVTVACCLICFLRTCFVDPGRVPADWQFRLGTDNDMSQRRRWCRKCEAYKPARAHHCRTCERCIVKMDHHCVWTANCVSHVTFPHFVRFLSYAVTAMVMLATFLWQRLAILWQRRHLPSYLGPSGSQLGLLLVVSLVNTILLLALGILLARTIWSLLFNTTTIESWEIERHETLLRRARVLGGFLHGPNGSRVRIERQEFPWDVGIWANVCQAMGSRNPLAWMWPLARSPPVESGLAFEHNEIEDPRKPWPPPDPDRLYRAPHRSLLSNDAFTQPTGAAASREQQAVDTTRERDAIEGEYVVRRRPFHERLEATQQHPRGIARDRNGCYDDDDVFAIRDGSDSGSEAELNVTLGGENKNDDAGEEAWRNREGERLADFGVDEVAEFYDEDMPLAGLPR